jgi:hypothetical protein
MDDDGKAKFALACNDVITKCIMETWGGKLHVAMSSTLNGGVMGVFLSKVHQVVLNQLILCHLFCGHLLSHTIWRIGTGLGDELILVLQCTSPIRNTYQTWVKETNKSWHRRCPWIIMNHDSNNEKDMLQQQQLLLLLGSLKMKTI